jgi:predicted nucleic acid-binding protein
MVFLDANVFLYAAGGSDPYREPCRRVLRNVEDGSLPSNTSVEVVQELLYVLWRRGLAEKGIRLARDVIALFPELLPQTRDDLGDACGLLSRNPGLTPRDAVHVATMRRHGIDTIVSADSHFDGIQGIRRVDPARVES